MGLVWDRGSYCPGSHVSLSTLSPQTTAKVFKQRSDPLKFVTEDDVPVAQREGGQPDRTGVFSARDVKASIGSLLGFRTERVNALAKVRTHPGPSGLGGPVPIQFSQQPTSIGMKNLFLTLLLNPNLNRIHHY